MGRMILAADNLQVLNPVVANALKALDPKPLQRLARQCEDAGAQAIDINPGYLSKRYEDRMTFMVETVQEACSRPLILDSPHPRILAKGLSVCRDKPILNAATLEKGRLEETLALAAENKTQLIILLLDERSHTPPRMDEKITLALEIRDRALSAGLEDQDLLFDPVLPNLSWQEAFIQVAEVIKTVQMLAGGLIMGEPAKTVVGLSNLRSGLKKRFPVHVDQTCLSLLAGAGLHMVLANVLDPEIIQTWRLISQMT